MLAPIADGLWAAQHDHYMHGFLHFRGRMTVVRLEDGSLLLHSPVPIDDALADDLAALGPVAHLVAPNRLHHTYLPGACARYPEATLWGAPGLPEKRPDLVFDAVLGKTTPPWRRELEPRLLEGNAWASELVFFHHASRTLLVTDLVFNIHHASNIWTRLLLRSVGAYRQLAQSRLWRSTTKDRDAMQASVEAVLAFPFSRLVMAHGEIVQDDAHAALSRALRWMRGTKSLPAAA